MYETEDEAEGTNNESTEEGGQETEITDEIADTEGKEGREESTEKGKERKKIKESSDQSEFTDRRK